MSGNTFGDMKVTDEPTNELQRIALKIGEVVEREIRALGFQDEELQFVLIATRPKNETTGETGMVSTVGLEELAAILARNLEAILGPEAMEQYRELFLRRGEPVS